MGKWIRRTITVTIIETWTFVWTDEVEAAQSAAPYSQRCASLRRVVVTSSTVSSQHFLQDTKGESTDATT